MNKRLSNKWLHYGLLGSFYVLAAATFLVHGAMHALPGQRGQADATASHCQVEGKTIFLNIYKDSLSPANITARRCDRLEVINRDSRPRRPIFGEHHDHADYLGFIERTLGPGESSGILLTETGHYLLHDHFKAELISTLVIE